MRKQLTAEQIAKRDERKAKFKALWKQVAAMPELERVEMSNKLGLVTCEGHPLSLCNTMLIALQLPGASVLGGFRQWLKHGRCVRKGEHGAMIWVPIGHKATEPTTGETTTEMDETRFIIGTVFDVSQTIEVETGTNGQDRENYTDTQNRESYTPTAEPLVPALPAPAPAVPVTKETALAEMTKSFFQNMAGKLVTTGGAQ